MSIVESIRFGRAEVPCGGHSDLRYTIRWASPDGVGHHRESSQCLHPLCDQSPWVFLVEGPRHPEVLTIAWIRHAGVDVAVAYVLRIFDLYSLPKTVARIGIPDQWEDPRIGNHHDELFSRRYYADTGRGVYPAAFTEVL